MTSFLAVLTCVAVWGEGPADSKGLEARLLPLVKAHKGHVAIAVKHLKTGESYYFNADEPMPTASLIKLPVAAVQLYAVTLTVFGLADITYPVDWLLFRNHPAGTSLSPLVAVVPLPFIGSISVSSWLATYLAALAGALPAGEAQCEEHSAPHVVFHILRDGRLEIVRP